MYDKIFSQKINKQKLFNLIIGIVGIYVTFCIGGVLHEYILKKPYRNRIDGSQTFFSNAAGLIAIEKVIIFLFGYIYNWILLRQNQTPIPAKNSFICALIVFISSITNNSAIIMVSYPIVIMFKSCNILTVIMIGVFCSRVKNKNLKLTGNKLISAITVSIGIIMFKVFDPQAKVGDQRKVEIIGLLFLFVSLLADGFLPDFQAEIKEKYQPKPTVMMVEINKWCCIISVAYCLITAQFLDILNYAWRHPLFSFHLLLMSSLAFIGHIFIYNMIKDFKQHIVPFVITTRKIISVGISMIYFGHASNFFQLMGILIVLGSTFFEFLSEIMKSEKEHQKVPLQQKSKHSQRMEDYVENVIKTEVHTHERKDSDEQMIEKTGKN